MRALTTVHLAAGERDLCCAGGDRLLHFGLPNLAGLRLPVHDEAPAEAAE